MSDVIKEFLVGLGFKVDEAGMQKFIGGIEKATKQVAIFAGGVEVMAAGVFYAVDKVAQKLYETGELGKRIDLPVEEIEKFSFVAEQLGASGEAAKSSLEGVEKAAGLAAIGLGRGRKVFAQLNISVKDTNGQLKKAPELLSEIGNKIKGLGRGEQLAIISRLGIDQKLLRTLTTDTSALNAEFEKFQKASGFNANKAAADAEKFTLSFKKLKFFIEQLEETIASKFFGRFTKGMDDLTSLLVERAPDIINALTPIITTILGITGAFTKFAVLVISDLGEIVGWLGRANQATEGWSNRILELAAAWRFFNLQFLFTPVGLVLAGLTAIVLLIDDIRNFAENGKSLFDWSAAMPALNAMWKILKFIGGEIALIIHFFTGQWGAAMEDAAENTQLFKGAVRDLFDSTSKTGEFIAKGLKGEHISILQEGSRTPLGSSGAFSQNISQETTINIHGNDDPRSTAQAVSEHQYLTNADFVRNFKGNYVGGSQ